MLTSSHLIDKMEFYFLHGNHSNHCFRRENKNKLNLTYKKAQNKDSSLLIDLYNAAFYDDYKHYGECPGYGKTKEQNIKFYTEKCGFYIGDRVMDGTVEVIKFYMER